MKGYEIAYELSVGEEISEGSKKLFTSEIFNIDQV